MQVIPYIQECLERIEETLDRLLPAADNTPEHLHKAMRYASLGGGKRIRPLLVYATGHALGIPKDKLDVPAAAVEFIHAYSLIHDDLPAMDDDNLRRGKPTCHIAFDEGTAILAGDALQSLAFEVLAHADDIKPEQRIKLVGALTKAAGSFGMVGGQAIDLAAQPATMNADQLAHMHRCKTGALIRASIQMAAHIQPISQETYNQLNLFAEALGLAFQIQDDILDIEGDTEEMGKNQGSDLEANKATYPSLLGLTGAKQWLEQLHQEALSILAHMDGDTEYLKHITEFAIKRKQ